jgi:heptosyltransferase-3
VTAPRSVLIVVLRRLGDVLLATPLVRSIKHAWPQAAVDVLVFRGTEVMLAGNPDIRAVITMSERPGAAETLALIRRLWRAYDLAISAQTGDRPTTFTVIAGRRRAGMSAAGWGGALKRLFLHVPVPQVTDLHRITDTLRLATAVGAAPVAEIVPPRGDAALPLPTTPYVVLHANPFYSVRRWHQAGWRGLAATLHRRGFGIVVTGGRGADEAAYLDALWGGCDVPVQRFDGRLSWPELAALLRGAAVYVGPDTSVTHLAAAIGVPCVALYGPVDPLLIGPWPVGGLDRPWERSGTIQHRGNVRVVQNPLPCLPCERLGCLNQLDSYSRCLDELSLGQVLTAVDAALAHAALGAARAD